MITIVSGLPRSGTSLMMQMLAAGGLTLLTDGLRKSDTDNPRGYCEWEPIKRLPKEPALINEAEDKVVKVITQLLMALPSGHDYRVIFMERPLAEVIVSQDEMLRRRGTFTGDIDQATIIGAFEGHLKQVNAWLADKPYISMFRMGYHQVLQDAARSSQAIQSFLGRTLNIEAMTQCVDMSLYRNRGGGKTA